MDRELMSEGADVGLFPEWMLGKNPGLTDSWNWRPSSPSE